MPDLSAAREELVSALGDFLERGRPDGVFHLAEGGPGSVPPLADLDRPELHLDALPTPLTDAQEEALRRLAYRPEAGDRWTHPGGWRLVICDHDDGWAARQRALRDLLLDDGEAARLYRQRFLSAGREATDAALWDRALDHHRRTVGFRPAQLVARTLEGVTSPWMFAAGVALDLHLGRVLRPHDDIDVAVDREAQPGLVARLSGWRLDVPGGGSYHAWTGPLVPPQHQIHARHPELPGVLMLDLLLTDLSGGLWHYRRDPRVTLPLERARRHTPGGLPYLTPEAVLLFKAGRSGQPRHKDEADFRRVRPSLDAPARAWLREALMLTNPGHVWLEALE